MPTYESDLIIPSVAGICKPGVERYSFPAKAAALVQEHLPAGEVVQAGWLDGNKLSVTVASANELSGAELQQVRDAVAHVFGEQTSVPDFEEVRMDAQQEG